MDDSRLFFCEIRFVHKSYDEDGKSGDYGVWWKKMIRSFDKSTAKIMAIKQFRKDRHGLFYMSTFNKSPFKFTKIKEIKKCL